MTEIYYSTDLGKMIYGDSLQVIEKYIEPKSVDLIMTSPPFGLVRKKDYGNVDATDYIDWFREFGQLFRHILKENGSLVIDIGGSWRQCVKSCVKKWAGHYLVDIANLLNFKLRMTA